MNLINLGTIRTPKRGTQLCALRRLNLGSADSFWLVGETEGMNTCFSEKEFRSKIYNMIITLRKVLSHLFLFLFSELFLSVNIGLSLLYMMENRIYRGYIKGSINIALKQGMKSCFLSFKNILLDQEYFQRWRLRFENNIYNSKEE